MIIMLDNLDYNGENKLDISFVTGDSFYCPGWKMVCDYKNKIISEKIFKKLYLNLMRNRFNNPKMQWKMKSLLKKEKIVFCVDKNEIHQFWLEEIIKQELIKQKEI